MKKIFLIILFGWTVLFGAYDECITDIYFGNGVWNDYAGASQGRDELEKVLIRDIYITMTTKPSGLITSPTEAMTISTEMSFCLRSTGREALRMRAFRSKTRLSI